MSGAIAARQVPPLTPGTPVSPPPPGVTSNFTAPSESADRILQVNVACIVLAVVFMTLRLIARVRVSRCVGLDDYVSVVALAFILAYSGMALRCRAVGMGRHVWDVEAITFYEGRFFMASTRDQDARKTCS
jgi:hypothetical protein